MVCAIRRRANRALSDHHVVTMTASERMRTLCCGTDSHLRGAYALRSSAVFIQ